jgi:threonine dehydratase
VHTVEPEGYDDTRRSLESGRRLAVDTLRPSICDALLSPSPGKLTFPILEREVESGLAVSEADVREAMRYARRRLRLVVEPGGAVALAAVLARKVETRGEVTAVMVSGGNVDVDLYAEIQAGPT